MDWSVCWGGIEGEGGLVSVVRVMMEVSRCGVFDSCPHPEEVLSLSLSHTLYLLLRDLPVVDLRLFLRVRPRPCLESSTVP